MSVVFNRRRLVAGGGYIIEGSGFFDPADGKLSDTPSAGDSNQIFTICIDGKHTFVPSGANDHLFSAGPDTSNYWDINWTTTGALEIALIESAGVVDQIVTTQLFRDFGALYQLVVGVDKTAGASGDRYTIEYNGVAVTDFSTDTREAAGGDTFVGKNNAHYVNAFTDGGRHTGDYISRFAYIDGTKLDATSFGEETSDGYWQINDASGLTFGTNGFLLEGGVDVAAGTDSSGNSNDFTPAGTITATNDSPTNDQANGYGNYCTLNPIDPLTTSALSNGNLTSGAGNSKVTLPQASGDWYYEKDGSGVSVSGAFDPVLTAGTYNFGATAWADTGPTGAEVAVATQNFPAPAVPDYREEYHVEKFTHDGTSHVITLPWSTTTYDTMVRIKDVDNVEDWFVFDTIRGDNNDVRWNVQVGEATTANSCAFSGTSVTLGSHWSASDHIIEAFKVGSYFQIKTYTGSGANKTEAYPGTLDSAPGLLAVISRTTTGTYNPAWHSSIANTAFLRLDTTAAIATDATMWNSTSPTTTALSLGSSAESNANANTYVAYAWANSGPYAFGSYTGNSNADGPMVNVGGFHQMVWLKRDAIEPWVEFDNVRETFNTHDQYLVLNTTAAPTGPNYMDFVSTGLKVRTASTTFNGSGTLLYGMHGITPIQGPDPASSPNQGRAV